MEGGLGELVEAGEAGKTSWNDQHFTLPPSCFFITELTCPVVVSVIGQRHDVVVAGLPRQIRLVLPLGVDGGRGVKGVDGAVEVDVVDELVEVVVPVGGVLVVKVRAHGPDDVIRAAVGGLVLCVGDKLGDKVVQVVVVQARVVLDLVGVAVKVHAVGGAVTAATAAVQLAGKGLGGEW